MKIALFADTHLSDVESTPQEEALDWALEQLALIKPDACVCLGDITACGSPDAAMHFRKKIDGLPCPSVIVPGNADIRTDSTAPILQRFLFSHPKGLKIGNIHIVGMDTSHDSILPEERARLAHLELGDNILLCSHQPAKYLDADSLEFIRNWIRERKKNNQRILMWASGHRHVYERSEFEGIPTLSLRALDIDKCIGGSAQICILTQEDGTEPTIDELVYSRSLPQTWNEDERFKFSQFLGITCYDISKISRDMPFAIKNRVRHLEWRSIDEGELSLLEKWRRNGGQSFSLHLPKLGFDGSVINIPAFKSAAMDAVRAEADMITVHPPYILNEKMQSSSPIFSALADAAAEALLPVAKAGIDILVENNHTRQSTPHDPLKREYGCSPIEICGWRDAMTERLGADSCHLRLDVGHARNNMPLSQEYPIGKWYALVGAEARAYHLHQTVMNKAEKRMYNHYPITGLHDGLVAFDGFLWAWRAGILHHGPIILEIRESEGAPATWERLQRLILGTDCIPNK